MSHRTTLVVAAGLAVALAGCSDTSATPAPTTPSGASVFFAHQADQADDTFTAPNNNTYRVRAGGRMVRTDAKSTLDMPSFGGMLGQGDQSRDHDYSIATARVAPDTVRAMLTLRSGTSTHSVRALRGIATGGEYYAVFAVRPAFDPGAVESITRTDASGKSVTVKR